MTPVGVHRLLTRPSSFMFQRTGRRCAILAGFAGVSDIVMLSILLLNSPYRYPEAPRALLLVSARIELIR